jgi:2',3'-cyclic-nucleotide 2'-phosphodiesterase (5'-nucleotidase family)
MKEVGKRASTLVATALLICLTVLSVASGQGQSRHRHHAAKGRAATLAASQPTRPKPPARLYLINASIPEQSKLVLLLAPFSAKVHALDLVIAKLPYELKNEGIGTGTIGNFVTDAMRERAAKALGEPVAMAITNYGGMRKASLPAGDLHVLEIYELLPFENTLVELELTGEQLLNLLRTIIPLADAQSGARITYRTDAAGKPEVLNVRLYTGKGEETEDLIPSKVYKIVTIDYLVKRGGDYALLQQAKSMRALQLTQRDAVLDYVRDRAKNDPLIKLKMDERFYAVKSATAP